MKLKTSLRLCGENQIDGAQNKGYNCHDRHQTTKSYFILFKDLSYVLNYQLIILIMAVIIII